MTENRNRLPKNIGDERVTDSDWLKGATNIKRIGPHPDGQLCEATIQFVVSNRDWLRAKAQVEAEERRMKGGK